MGLLKLTDLVFSCHRDYTNPYLPVAPSAIDGGGQVRTYPLLTYLYCGGFKAIFSVMLQNFFLFLSSFIYAVKVLSDGQRLIS
jgi:hypothetical protein